MKAEGRVHPLATKVEADAAVVDSFTLCLCVVMNVRGEWCVFNMTVCFVVCKTVTFTFVVIQHLVTRYAMEPWSSAPYRGMLPTPSPNPPYPSLHTLRACAPTPLSRERESVPRLTSRHPCSPRGAALLEELEVHDVVVDHLARGEAVRVLEGGALLAAEQDVRRDEDGREVERQLVGVGGHAREVLRL